MILLLSAPRLQPKNFSERFLHTRVKRFEVIHNSKHLLGGSTSGQSPSPARIVNAGGRKEAEGPCTIGSLHNTKKNFIFLNV